MFPMLSMSSTVGTGVFLQLLFYYLGPRLQCDLGIIQNHVVSDFKIIQDNPADLPVIPQINEYSDNLFPVCLLVKTAESFELFFKKCHVQYL